MLKMSEMPYTMGFRIKLYLSSWHKHVVSVNDGAKRSVYNLLVAAGNERYHMSKTADLVPVYRDRIDFLQETIQRPGSIQNALPYLYEDIVDSQAVANAIQNYRKAWKNQKENHTGVPVFKKKSYEQSYQTNAHYHKGTNKSNVRFGDAHHVVLPKLGKVRFGGSPKIVQMLLERDDIRIGTITISRDSAGEYWASFALGSETPFTAALAKTGKQEGIDLNLLEMLNTSNGDAYANMRYYKAAEETLAKEQRKLNRKLERAKKEGRNIYHAVAYQEQRRKVAVIHRRIARQREDYLHVVSKGEIESQDLIVAEDLQVRNLVKNHRLAKAIHDVSWRRFLTMLQYKAQKYGKEVILVPPQYTSQTCSACGYVLQRDERLTLADREWTCPHCHTHHHRDVNAAEVILQRGLTLLSKK